MTNKEGRIIKGVGGQYTVMSEGKTHICKARGVFRKEKITPTVGDFVIFTEDVITQILPRKNYLIRPPVANIDKLFIVAAVSSPDPDGFYLDKLTVISEFYGIEPVLIFNKLDLGDSCNICDRFDLLPYRKYLMTSDEPTQKNLSGAALLAKELAGNTAAFAGLSGVGKSSILNLLASVDGSSAAHAEVGTVSEKLLRGKHTTRHVELFPLCGGYIVDTPGFGSLEFSYFDLKDRSMLSGCFPEFQEYLGSCYYQDCRHVGDEGCALFAAVQEGAVNRSRYESYCRMYASLGEYKPWEDKK